jgi:hypothetical protein
MATTIALHNDNAPEFGEPLALAGVGGLRNQTPKIIH